MKAITLKAARVNAGFTQRQVENQLGYARSTLTRWESGKCNPNAQKLKALCELYGISLGDLAIK